MNKKISRQAAQTVVFSPRGKTQVIGMRPAIFNDLYYFFLRSSWIYLCAFVVLAYIGANAFFATLYVLGGDTVANMPKDSFWEAFFFSVQTMATIGFGYMYPKTMFAHVLVTIESLVGLLGFAMITGIVFAKFSRPAAKVIFSKKPVITRHDGKPTLMFRVANERASHIADATIHVVLVLPDRTAEGRSFTRLLDLTLIRHRSPMFVLTWQVMHTIDERSPLFPETAESLVRKQATLVCSLTGFDTTIGQTIHTRHNYLAEDLAWNSRFADILTRAPDTGGPVINYLNFHLTETE